MDKPKEQLMEELEHARTVSQRLLLTAQRAMLAENRPVARRLLLKSNEYRQVAKELEQLLACVDVKPL